MFYSPETGALFFRDNCSTRTKYSLEKENELLKIQNEALEAKVKFYEERFRLEQQKKYGSPSDQVHPEQMAFNEVEKLSAQPAEEPVIEVIEVKYNAPRCQDTKIFF